MSPLGKVYSASVSFRAQRVEAWAGVVLVVASE